MSTQPRRLRYQTASDRPSDAPPQPLQLGVGGFVYADLYRPEKLAELHSLFMAWLKEQNEAAHACLQTWYAAPETLNAVQQSAAIVEIAPYVGRFVARLFNIEAAAAALASTIRSDEPLFEFKKRFVKRRMVRPDTGSSWSEGLPAAEQSMHEACANHAPGSVHDPELQVATTALALLDLVAEAEDALASRQLLAIETVLTARLADPDDAIHRWVAFFVPHKQNPASLVPLRRSRVDLPEQLEGEQGDRRERSEPFALTDGRATRREVAKQVDYCVICQERDKDSCSKGLHDKQGVIKRNPLGIELNGCPLDEKIGEAHALRRSGAAIGALAAIAIDNPMAPGTGHRICNDCMKACIYQAQEPVNIPEVETRALTDVLELPWGFEIYSFLTRWNPLNVKRPYAQPYIGKNVLVVGVGPAGYTLSHHLLNEGFGVVAVDGLKLEPMPLEWVGSAEQPPLPIYDYRVLRQPLESRTLLGFGGVSEYGITVRWDKNFLAVMYLNLLRRRHFRAYGGIRFGGTLTVEDAWDLGFDHIAIAAGAGRPTAIDMKNYLIRGVRKASDLLMALQLTGAYKRDSLANLQVRLPAIVIGGGLTAIDTATELLAYYVVQVERTVERYETLAAELGEETLRQRFDAEELGILDEAVAHGRALCSERQQAATAGRQPRLQELLQSWGGVQVVYRRNLQDAPAYRLNHEEVHKALEEGIRFVERLTPLEAHPDAYGAVEAMSFERWQQEDGRWQATGEIVRLPARTVCIAAGTKPNISYENEYAGTFELDERSYLANHRAVRQSDGSLQLQRTDDQSGFFTSYLQQERTVSYYGDNHPKYAGNVVKAMASAKHGYRAVAQLFAPHIEALRAKDQPARDVLWSAFVRHLHGELLATVREVRRLAPDIIEVIVHAPIAARKFQPGQFYRLQNFEAYAPRIDGTPLLMEGLALTGAWVDREKGLLSTIALEMGTSSRMCAMLKPGEPVLLMGPTGAPTETPGDETVLLAGGGLGNAVLFSIARALRERGSRVIYFAGYRRGESLFKQAEVEACTNQVVWSTDAGAPIAPRRPQDSHFRGNIVQSMLAYQRGELGERLIDLRDVDRIVVIGSDRMMAAVKEARRTVLAPYLKPCHKAIGSINSPMQCMLKAICAQCLQRVVDPQTGQESMVYTCFNQDLELDRVDFAHLAARLRQNSTQEKLSNLWFDRMLQRADVVRV